MPRHRRHHTMEDSGRTQKPSNQGGFDISSLANIANLVNTIDMNKISGLLGALSNSNLVNNSREDSQDPNSPAAQRKDELANALRVLINADKSELLQVALQFYAASRNNQNNIEDNP